MSAQLPLLPIGIQDFESLRKGGFLYIDKTEQLYRLANTGRYYFLSRPRRFGKSLTVTTLEAYFRGKKELFKGLAIEQLEKDWAEHPVLHLDLNTQQYDAPEKLTRVLNEALAGWEQLYGANPAEVDLSRRFQGVIRRASEQSGRGTVILVDEYDKPMLQAIGNEPLADEYRDTLKAFYGALKSMDRYIRFGLLTGVTKFGKVSVFSDLNNLEDISRDNRHVEICGITEGELRGKLTGYVEGLAKANKLTEEETYAKLKEYYDGYHFTEDAPGLYNPFSLLNTLAKQTFGSYWFETGTPTYLVELMQAHHYDLYRMAHEETGAETLDCIDPHQTDPIPVIYQSGYLTIKGYDPEFGLYTLGFPNREVEEGFVKFLVPYYTPFSQRESTFEVSRFVKEIRTGDIEGFFRRLQSFLADTPYELARNVELHYQNVLFIVFKLMGFYVQAEYHTSQGRVDLVLQTTDYVYVMEFKLEGSAEEAMQQIEEKGYARPFAADRRKVYKIGINFSQETRNIEKWLVEEA